MRPYEVREMTTLYRHYLFSRHGRVDLWPLKIATCALQFAYTQASAEATNKKCSGRGLVWSLCGRWKAGGWTEKVWLRAIWAGLILEGKHAHVRLELVMVTSMSGLLSRVRQSTPMIGVVVIKILYMAAIFYAYSVSQTLPAVLFLFSIKARWAGLVVMANNESVIWLVRLVLQLDWSSYKDRSQQEKDWEKLL